jgi:CubicO group peptidase (beta-lactamase class C family)
MRVAIASVLVLGFAARVAAAPCPLRASWPTDEWPDATQLVQATRGEAIRALEDFAFTLVGGDEERLGARTDAVVIVKDGALLYERYAREYTARMPHYAWSMTKSFTNALTGIAVLAGLVSLDDSICDHTVGVRLDHCKLSLRHLIEFASGMSWTESYEGRSNQVSSVLAMLYGEGHGDVVRFITSHEFRDEPGTTFMYSSGDSTLLSSAIDGPLRARHGEDYAWTTLFDKLGMTSAVFESDLADHPIGSSWLYATPRDFARFGWFLLSDGCWADERILPEGWVATSTTPSEPFKRRALDVEPDDVQGWQLWLNRIVPEAHVDTLPWPDVPDDAYAARGHWGQSITVVPSLGMVIVRLADDRDGTFDFNGFLMRAIAVAQ